MRVLHVINGLTTGGAETVLYRLTTYPSDVEHEVICLEHRASFSDRLEAAGIRVHHLDWTSPAGTLSAWFRLRRLIRRSRPDLIQAWMYRSNVMAGLAGKLAGIPVVWNIRCTSVSTLRRASRFLARLGGLFARSIPRRIVNCSRSSVKVHARLGYDPAKVVVIPNGYDVERFEPDDESRDSTRAELGIDSGQFLVGSIGRWDPEKAYGLLIHAVCLLRDRALSFRLLLVGRRLDWSNPDLVRLIDEHGCADIVQPIGERRDVAALARALDLHVLSSRSEGFPNVVAETMLCGTPNAVTEVGDSALIAGDTGWVVQPGDAEQLAAAIEQAHAEWTGSPDRWRKRQEAARRQVADNFSLALMVRSYEAVWRDALGKRTDAAEDQSYG